MQPRPWAETVRSRSVRVCMAFSCPVVAACNQSARTPPTGFHVEPAGTPDRRRGARPGDDMLGAVARRTALPYLAAAVGGVLGALARWGLGRALPHDAGSWPWATLLVNLSGCLLLGL